MIFNRLTIGLIAGFSLCFLLLACKEEAPVVKEQPAPKVVFKPNKAKSLLGKRVLLTESPPSQAEKLGDYVRLKASFSPPSGLRLKNFLEGTLSDDTQSVVILAHFETNEGTKLPGLPLYIFQKEKENWLPQFQANDYLTPWINLEKGHLLIELEVVYLSAKLDGIKEDATQISALYAQNNALISQQNIPTFGEAIDRFSQRIALVQEGAITKVTTFTLETSQQTPKKLSFIGSDALNAFEISYQLEGRNRFINAIQNTQDPYGALMFQDIARSNIHSALSDLQIAFWAADEASLSATCKAMDKALYEQLGISSSDRNMILQYMLERKDVFSPIENISDQCRPNHLQEQLQSSSEPIRTPSSTRLNQKLSQIARHLKNLQKTDINRLMETISDQPIISYNKDLGFLLDENYHIQTQDYVSYPSVSNVKSTDFLTFLPIDKFGCFGRGPLRKGIHRTSLLTFENDPYLWLIDFSFNPNEHINGISLRKASQVDYCRAIGGRTGDNQCVFAERTFPQLDASRCGR